MACNIHALRHPNPLKAFHIFNKPLHGQSAAEPLTISMLERHPLGSQAFYPLQDEEWLVVVGKSPAPEALRVFLASGRQGVNYAPGTWHHPLIVFSPGSRFLVVDRGGDGNNLEEVSFAPTLISSSRP